MTPARYVGRRLIAKAISATICVPCAAYMQLDLAGARPNGEQIEMRRMLAADKRARRRAAMRQAQQTLF